MRLQRYVWLAAAALGAFGLSKRMHVDRRPRAIRDAGPSEMRNPPRHWDLVDEENDESFPASDPPGNY
ncbi:MAG: hypothetical protein VX874_03215 [Pseudomonadota bacterium]|nr:hypothetical protein [Pseudomonadota bacterium]